MADRHKEINVWETLHIKRNMGQYINFDANINSQSACNLLCSVK